MWTCKCHMFIFDTVHMWEYWIQMWIFLCVNQIHRWHFLKGSASLSLLCQGAAQLNYVHSLTTNWLIKPLRTFVLFFTLSFLHFFYAFLTCIVTSAKIATRMAAVCVCLYNEWHSKDELMNLGQKKKRKKKDKHLQESVKDLSRKECH